MKLTKAQKKKIYEALPTSSKKQIKRIATHGAMSGKGWSDIWSNIKKYAGPIAQEVGPVILKEFVVPAIKAKMGSGKMNKYKSAKDYGAKKLPSLHNLLA